MTTLPHRAEGDLGHISDHNVLADHNNGTTSVHGIADTSVLATQTDLAAKTTKLTYVSPAKTGTYTGGVNEFVPWDTSGGTGTHTLPNAPANGTRQTIYLETAGNTLTVNRAGSDVFGKSGGVTSKTMTGAGQILVLDYQSGVWRILQDVANSVGPGTNVTLSAVSGGVVNVNVDPAASALWTPLQVTFSGDQSVTSSTSVVDATNFKLTGVANGIYRVRAEILFDADVAGDFRVGWSTTATSSTFDWVTRIGGHSGWTAGVNPSPLNNNLSIGTTQQVAAQAAGTIMQAEFVGTWRISTTPGDLQFKFAQGTSSGTATILKANSMLVAQRYA